MKPALCFAYRRTTGEKGTGYDARVSPLKEALKRKGYPIIDLEPCDFQTEHDEIRTQVHQALLSRNGGTEKGRVLLLGDNTALDACRPPPGQAANEITAQGAVLVERSLDILIQKVVISPHNSVLLPADPRRMKSALNYLKADIHSIDTWEALKPVLDGFGVIVSHLMSSAIAATGAERIFLCSARLFDHVPFVRSYIKIAQKNTEDETEVMKVFQAIRGHNCNETGQFDPNEAELMKRLIGSPLTPFDLLYTELSQHTPIDEGRIIMIGDREMKAIGEMNDLPAWMNKPCLILADRHAGHHATKKAEGKIPEVLPLPLENLIDHLEAHNLVQIHHPHDRPAQAEQLLKLTETAIEQVLAKLS